MHAALMLDSLDGLSVGEALGQQFPVMGRSIPDILAGNLPAGQWDWTDDTEMACTLVAELGRHDGIDQDRLAARFAAQWEPRRDYGFATVGTLRQIRDGVHWRVAAAAAFGGQGSCGNGAAMRVAPLGAYYAGDPEKVVAEAVRSAQVTHLHTEGVAGAVAVALAAGQPAHARVTGTPLAPREFITAVIDRLGDGEMSQRVRRARALLGAPTHEAVQVLGNGSRVTAQDTVPFTLWVASTHLDDYPAAIATCLAADGDIDTTSAIVGGIVAAHTGRGSRPGRIGVPEAWVATREPLPSWVSTVRAQRRQKSGLGFGRIREWFVSDYPVF
ncbi:ADP-ribosylglycohydrolase family protein [Nocardia australiensis]|uniref:ADP-ribosylglycohydrolase family protein n=1 Tax=Nocardia australiensis TaxID=2887191 RepID=UPI001D1514B5|nr:ADP-ribosylglycohydrolase family protein [Nocardia australiensis]